MPAATARRLLLLLAALTALALVSAASAFAAGSAQNRVRAFTEPATTHVGSSTLQSACSHPGSAAGSAELAAGFCVATEDGSPILDPAEFAGKTPAEIDQLAQEKGLIPKGPDPMNGRGSYIDPVTGEQRVLSHPNEPDGGNLHVNDPSGQRLDINGNPVSKYSDAAHLPIGQP